MVSNEFRYILSMGTLGKKEMIIPSLNVSLNTILRNDIYVALEQELCLPSRSEYIRLIASSTTTCDVSPVAMFFSSLQIDNAIGIYGLQCIKKNRMRSIITSASQR